MAYVEIIESNEHFVELTKAFDKKYSTTTSFVELSLNEIWDNFYLNSDPDIRWWANDTYEYTNAIITSKIKEIFHDTGEIEICNTDPRISEGMIGKINSMYLMKKDILSGKGFVDPMCVSVFPNGNSPVHPGGTRMNWANHYTNKMKVVLTTYGADTGLDIRPIEEFDFDLKGKAFNFMVGNSIEDAHWLSYKKAAMDLNITYKQIQNLSEEYFKFLRPNEIDETITFRLDKNKLFVNDMLLAYKLDMWRLTLDE